MVREPYFFASAALTVLLGIANLTSLTAPHQPETFLLLLVAGLVLDQLSSPARRWKPGSGYGALGLTVGLGTTGAGWLFSTLLFLLVCVRVFQKESPASIPRSLPILAAVTTGGFAPQYGLPLAAVVYLVGTLWLYGLSLECLREGLEELFWAALLHLSSGYGIWVLLAALVGMLAIFPRTGKPTEELKTSFAHQMSTTESTLKASKKKFRRDTSRFKDLLSQQALFNDFQGRALQAGGYKDLARVLVDTVAGMNPNVDCGVCSRKEGLVLLDATASFEIADFETLPSDLKPAGFLRSTDGKRAVCCLTPDYLFFLQIDREPEPIFFDFLDHLMARARLILRIQRQSRELGLMLAEKTNALERLAESQAQLMQAEKLAGIGQLAAGIAHELNSPLTAIQLQNRLAKRRLEKQNHEGVLKSLELSDSASEKAKGIIEGLLTYARVSAGEEKRESVTLSSIVQQTLTLLEERLRLAKIEVATRLEQLPPLKVNSREIDQILTNLILNATDALEEKTQNRHLSISSYSDGENQVVTVFNNGPPIDEDTLGKIFDPFFTTKDIGRGTGLGLSIAHELATSHGGRLTANNDADGVSFHLRLPCQQG